MKNCEIKRPHDVDVMSVSKLFLFLLILSVFAAPIFASGALKVNDENVVVLAIDRAEVAVVSAYETVLEAKRTRANVSELLDRLNVAGGHLAEAHMLYKLGDFDGAVGSADRARTWAEEVRDSAEELRIEAYESWIVGLLIRIIGSIVGVIAVAFGTFIAWRAFKRRYFQQA